MRQDIDLSAFSKGELSPRLKGRTDYKGYFEGCDTCLNMVVLPQGGATRRPGTVFSALVKDQANGARLIDFEFGITTTSQAYMLEFGQQYIRVYKDGFPVTNVLTVTGAVSNGGPNLIRLTVASTAGVYTGNTVTVANVGGVPAATGEWLLTKISATQFDLVGSTFAGLFTAGGTATVIVEIPTSYTIAQVNALHWCQSNDTLYLCHPDVAPVTLTRISHAIWTTQAMTMAEPIYYPTVGGASITQSATTGNITITSATPVFAATDIGRFVRIRDGADWGWASITGFTSTTIVDATVLGAVSNGASGAVPLGPTQDWYFSRWSNTLGWPWIPQFWQNRLFFIGDNLNPAVIVYSVVGDYTNFASTQADGSVTDVNGGQFFMTSNQVNSARWVSAAGSAQIPQLAIGTTSDEHILQGASAAGGVFSPTSVQVYEETSLSGRSNSRPHKIAKKILFANAAGRKLHEYGFDWQSNGYVGPEKQVESEHMTRGLIADMDWQRNPYGVLWVRMDDGSLKGMTYLPEQAINAWHQHTFGGNYYGGPPVVESICTIPAPDNSYDQLWLIVKRTINGAVVRTIEVMAPYFDAQTQEDAVFVDCALQSTRITQNIALTFDTIEKDTEVIFTTPSAWFSASNVDDVLRANGGIAFITSYASTTTVLGQWVVSPTNREPVAANAWSIDAEASSFAGLDHLEGETVRIFGDGADLSTAVVSGGEVIIPPDNGDASFATIGLDYTFRLVTMPWAAQAATIVQGHFKTIATLWLRFLDSLGADVGRKITDPMTNEIEYRTEQLETRAAGDDLGWAPPLFTGLYRLPLQGSYDMEGQIDIEGTGPYPCTVLAVVATGDVGELPGGPRT